MSEYVGLRQGKVHESHVMSEYYCGGCGWPVTDHDSFCPECGGAFRESDVDDALEGENAKLRTERDEWRRVAEAKQDIIDHMRDARAENAKLRELVKDMFLSATFWFDHFSEARRYRDRIRELGIEVDE